MIWVFGVFDLNFCLFRLGFANFVVFLFFGVFWYFVLICCFKLIVGCLGLYKT